MSANDDFFGGAITPPSAPPTAGAPANPHLANTKEYGNFGGSPARPTSSSSSLPLVIVGVAVAAALVLAFLGYRMFFVPKIELPEELLGMQRSNLETELDTSLGEIGNAGWLGSSEVKTHIGVYSEGIEMVAVMAGEAGTTDPNEVSQFFSGISEAMASQMSAMTLKPMDAGAPGGSMQCFETTSGGAKVGGCAWVAEDTFGMVIAGPTSRDLAQITRDIRSEIEN